jgi:hypothetical protein
MSKLDQLKALGDAKRAARKSSDGVVVADTTVKSLAEKAAKPFVQGVETGKGAASKPAAIQRQARGLGAGVAPGPSGAKPKRGRPKVEGVRQWEAEGVARRTWYRRQEEKRAKEERK